MVLTIGPELEAALQEQSKRRGIAIDRLALDALRDQFIPKQPKIMSHDEWLARLDAISTDCGMSLSDEALSRDNLYD